MNKKQILVFFFGCLVIIFIVMFTPRYKIAWIDSQNFIKTEQSSSLYKRSKGTVRLHWDKILIASGLTVLATATGMVLLSNRKKENG